MEQSLTEELTQAAPATAQEQAKLLAPTLAALSDENRLTIALLLADGPLTNKEIQERTGMSQALVSHHLVALRNARIVLSEPSGRATSNSLCCDHLSIPVKLLGALAAGPESAQCDLPGK